MKKNHFRNFENVKNTKTDTNQNVNHAVDLIMKN